MSKIISTIVAILSPIALLSQPHMSATIQNMHLWRGGLVADGYVMTSELHFSDPKEQFNIGFWGGTNSVGEYKEFNYYANYSSGNLTLALSDTYNFSSYASYNNDEFFNYQPSSTGRFLDATIKYKLSERYPLTLSWSTVIFGRDRNAENTENRYSTFCNIEYPIYKKRGWQIDAALGAAFALRNIDNAANFYGDKAGIVEATLKVSNSLKINDYEIPIYMMAMWNPQSDKAYLQLCTRLISF